MISKTILDNTGKKTENLADLKHLMANQKNIYITNILFIYEKWKTDFRNTPVKCEVDNKMINQHEIFSKTHKWNRSRCLKA